MDLHGSVEIVGSAPVLSLTGSVDLATVAESARPAASGRRRPPGGTVVVDLDGVDALDDAGLGVLLGAAGRARQTGGDLVVVCASEHLRERFAFTGLDRAVTVDAHAHRPAAVMTTADLYHIALADDWAAASRSGEYAISTRGRSLADEGFIHCSFAEQVDATATRFYADVDDAVVLRIDPGRLDEPGRGRGSRRHRRAVPPRLRADPGRRGGRGAPASTADVISRP